MLHVHENIYHSLLYGTVLGNMWSDYLHVFVGDILGFHSEGYCYDTFSNATNTTFTHCNDIDKHRVCIIQVIKYKHLGLCK